MWPFSKKWAAPEPQLAMLISLTSPELPSVIQVSNPAGADGAVPGMAGPAEAEPNAETMTTPMKAGQSAPGDFSPL